MQATCRSDVQLCLVLLSQVDRFRQRRLISRGSGEERMRVVAVLKQILLRFLLVSFSPRPSFLKLQLPYPLIFVLPFQLHGLLEASAFFCLRGSLVLKSSGFPFAFFLARAFSLLWSEVMGRLSRAVVLLWVCY